MSLEVNHKRDDLLDRPGPDTLRDLNASASERALADWLVQGDQEGSNDTLSSRKNRTNETLLGQGEPDRN